GSGLGNPRQQVGAQQRNGVEQSVERGVQRADAPGDRWCKRDTPVPHLPVREQRLNALQRHTAHIGVVRVVGHNMASQYENINRAMGAGNNGTALGVESATSDQLSKKSLKDFVSGSR
ncbi:MAG: hypothetical protein ACEQSR_12705, partial [Candidatus Methylacidiphilales bacterium]